MKKDHGLTGHWIAIGGSYPGSLAGWLRLKYPHLIQGSVASSGPVNAKPNFPEYLKVVDSALKTESDECSVNVKSAVNKVQYLTQHRLVLQQLFNKNLPFFIRVGWQMLGQKFHLCQPFDGTNKANVATLVETLLGNFETIIQYNKGVMSLFLYFLSLSLLLDKKTGKWSNITTKSLCDIMTNNTLGSELQRFVRVRYSFCYLQKYYLIKCSSFQVNELSLLIGEKQCLDADYGNKGKKIFIAK